MEPESHNVVHRLFTRKGIGPFLAAASNRNTSQCRCPVVPDIATGTLRLGLPWLRLTGHCHRKAASRDASPWQCVTSDCRNPAVPRTASARPHSTLPLQYQVTLCLCAGLLRITLAWPYRAKRCPRGGLHHYARAIRCLALPLRRITSHHLASA